MVGTYTIMTPIMANDSLTVSGNVKVRGDIEIGGDKISVLRLIASFNSLGLISSTATATVTTTVENLVSVSGKIGVGLMNPGYALDVEGDVNCSGQFLINGVPVPLIGDKVIEENHMNEGIVVTKRDERYYVEEREIEMRTADKNVEYMYVRDAISLSGNMIMDGMIAVSGLGIMMEEGGKGVIEVDEGNDFVFRLNKEEVMRVSSEGVDIRGNVRVNGVLLENNSISQNDMNMNQRKIVLNSNNIPINTLSLPSPNNLYYFVLNMRKGQKARIHINLVIFSVVIITTGWTVTRSVGSNTPLVNAYNVANGLEINRRDIGALVNAGNIGTVLGGGYCGANSSHSIVIDMIDEPEYDGNVCYALRGVGSNAGSMSYHLSYYVELI